MEKIPCFTEIKKICPDIEDNIINNHLEKIEDDYFDYFSIDDIPVHLKAISNLTRENPVGVICSSHDDINILCTVVAYDYHAVLSLITGILSSMDLKINSGRIFTYKKESYKIKKRIIKRKTGRSRAGLKKHIKKRVIIDHFECTLSSSIYSHVWVNELKKKFIDVFVLMGADNESAARAKEKVNFLVARKLTDFSDSGSVFYPAKIEVDNSNESYTLMKVFSEDTPFFLYALTTSLSLQKIQIEHVHLKTIVNQVVDEFIITDYNGNKIEDSSAIEKIKFSVLLTKQFTYFLGTAPDPYAALSRFEYLTEEIISLPEKENWVEMFSNPRLLKDLAKLLGASDFIWEDFIRLQYESILPLLQSVESERKILDIDEDFKTRLKRAMMDAEKRDDKIRILNEFKDREIFLIDLDHIVNPETDFRKLSERLTFLANAIISAAVELSYNYLVKVYGKPRTVAGLEAKYSVMGLGKFGGSALGYASDIELLVIYSDNGRTDGKKQVKNSEFFQLLVKDLISFIKAKKEGIFHLDMRLRPYGSDGPLAASLDAFCKYYGHGGDAHSYEKLALVRMRPVYGDEEFGRRLKRLRNEFIYSTKNIDIKELRELREKQFLEVKGKGRINAKFSPGALVDLEYTVQILQVTHWSDYPELRKSSIHGALNTLAGRGILDREETDQLIEAYDFLRKLINGLRMLRGSARDLYMPLVDSIEYGHLARRAGYINRGNLTAAKQLHIEFNTRTAMIRTFIEKYFGRESLPGENIGNVADIVLSPDISGEVSFKILSGYGFNNHERALHNLKKIAGRGKRAKLFARLAILAMDIMLHIPDPDMSLNNWERFISGLPEPMDHYRAMLSQPMELDIMLSLFSASQFLSNILINNHDFLDWVVLPENIHKSLNRMVIENELRSMHEKSPGHKDWLNSIRRLKKREILRIGTRDICLGIPLNEIVKDLSTLAEAFIQVVAEIFLLHNTDEYSRDEVREVSQKFSILAFGKLGGNELNYSSDIDLLMIYENSDKISGPEFEKLYFKIIETISSDLSSHIDEGYAYRVDLRLRPYGSSGPLACELNRLMDYYGENASLWEIQALLKIRPVAGNLLVGYRFIDMLKTLYEKKIPHSEIINSISRLRSTAIKENSGGLSSGIDVKNGIGGIRDIEFLTQGLQMIYMPRFPELRQANTLQALKILKELGILSGGVMERLSDDYIFMRRVEHHLQLFEDRQVHSLPVNPERLHGLAKIMMGMDSGAHDFLVKIDEFRLRIREAYNEYLIDFDPSDSIRT